MYSFIKVALIIVGLSNFAIAEDSYRMRSCQVGETPLSRSECLQYDSQCVVPDSNNGNGGICCVQRQGYPNKSNGDCSNPFYNPKPQPTYPTGTFTRYINESSTVSCTRCSELLDGECGRVAFNYFGTTVGVQSYMSSVVTTPNPGNPYQVCLCSGMCTYSRN